MKENLSLFNIDHIPRIYIIDQQGTVAYCGHPTSINTEEFINKLLEDELEKKPQKGGLTKEKFNEMKTVAEAILKTNVKKEDKFNLKILCSKRKNVWLPMEFNRKEVLYSEIVLLSNFETQWKIIKDSYWIVCKISKGGI